jgi:hypothetical protein
MSAHLTVAASPRSSWLYWLPAAAQSFRVQCPKFTALHPDPTAASTITAIGLAGAGATYASVFLGKSRQQISGGDGFATMQTVL